MDMTGVLSIDFETRSDIDLKKCGVHAYAESPHTDVWCLAWGLGVDEGMKTGLWVPGQQLPDYVVTHIKSGKPVAAWNAGFELHIWNMICTFKYGFPILRPEQTHCTMAAAMAMSFPRALDNAAEAIGLPITKDKRGGAIMRKYCVPARWEGDKPIWYNDPADLEALYAYCLQDIHVEREMAKRLRPLSASERELWLLDYKINLNGVKIDLEAVKAAQKIVAIETKRIDAEIKEATRGYVTAGTQVGRIKTFLKSEGVDLDMCELEEVRAVVIKLLTAKLRVAKKGNQSLAAELTKLLEWAKNAPETELRSFLLSEFGEDSDVVHTLNKAMMERLLARDDLTDRARTVLLLRQEIAKASNKKLDAMVASASRDGRARGLHIFHAASTGRWGGSRIQTQNMPRPSRGTKPEHVEAFIDDMLGDNWESWRARGLRPMNVISDSLRGLLTGEFIARDYASIESRVISWLAGEEWKLQAFRDFDDGHGHDMYKLAAAKIFGKNAVDINDDERSIGKVSELACLAEDTLVLTDRGQVPIQDVTLKDKLWDGTDFVSHSGVVYKGTKETISYDGLRATPDHLVWVEDHENPVPFGFAASSSSFLVRPGLDRKRMGYVPRSGFSETISPSSWGHLLRLNGMLELLGSILAAVGELKTEARFEMHGVQSEDTFGSSVAVLEMRRNEGSLFQSERPRVPQLRRSGNPIWVLYDSIMRRLDSGEPRFAERETNRPDRQQRALRPRQSEMVNSRRAIPEQAYHYSLCGRPRMVQEQESLRAQGDAVSYSERAVTRRYSEESQSIGRKKMHGLESYRPETRTVRTYDILNCGPRNRFVANGVLVHNCGFGGGVGAFQSMATVYRVSVPDDQAEEIKNAWRQAHPATKQFWYDLVNAAMEAVAFPGVVVTVGKTGKIKYKSDKGTLMCSLPSGRVLHYVRPSIVEAETPWGEMRKMVQFWGINSKTKHWQKQLLKPSIASENVTQATARDFLSDALKRLDKAGFNLVMHVHDEAVNDGPGDAELFARLMAETPTWGKGCPVAVAGWSGKRYRKG